MAKRTPGDNKPSHPRDLYYPPRPADVAQASNMDALSDVDAAGPSDNDFLVFDTATSLWTHQPLAAGDLPSHTHTEADITDLAHFTDADADARIALAILDDLADVSLASITANEVLVWQGTGGGSVWANKTLAELGAAELTGADFTGDVSVENTLTLEASGSGVASDLLFTSGGNSRWQIRKDAGSESGSNAGSNLDIVAFNDAGTAIATYLTINRASGDITTTSGNFEVQNGSLAWGGGAAISSSDDVLTSSLTLGGISDVTITSIASGEILKWNGSAWINQTLAEAGIAATSHTHTEADITDLSHYTSSDFNTDFISKGIGDLNNVSITGPANNDLLQFNGTAWVDRTLAEAGVSAVGHTHTESDITDLGDYLAVGDNATITGAWTFTATPTIAANASGDGQLMLEGDAGDESAVYLQTGSVNRWGIRRETTAEAGSNAGSDFQIDGYSDAGGFLGAYLTIERSTGDVDIPLGTLAWGGGAAISSSDNVVTGSLAMNDLSDAATSGESNNDVLQWNGSNWVNRSLATAGIAATGHTHTASDVTDLDTLYPKNSQLETISGDWVFTGDPDFTGSQVDFTGSNVKLQLGSETGRYIQFQAEAGPSNGGHATEMGFYGSGPHAISMFTGASGAFESSLVYRTTPNEWIFENSAGADLLAVEVDTGNVRVDAGDLEIANKISMASGAEVEWPEGGTDLRVFHNGSHGYFRAETGLAILASGSGVKVWNPGSATKNVSYIESITSTTTAPSGSPAPGFAGALHLIY